jgi:uncharacterized protein
VKIVLDTNVLIAAFVSRGYCHELFENCARQHTLITSDFILNEFQEKLAKKFKYEAEEISQAFDLLLARMQVVVPVKIKQQICRDSDDDNVIATAIAGDCDCIITGDKDLLVLKRFQSINIFSPNEFRTLEEAELN